jgi:hypothetical protein
MLQDGAPEWMLQVGLILKQTGNHDRLSGKLLFFVQYHVQWRTLAAWSAALPRRRLMVLVHSPSHISPQQKTERRQMLRSEASKPKT